jgi:hypothetical protein
LEDGSGKEDTPTLWWEDGERWSYHIGVLLNCLEKRKRDEEFACNKWRGINKDIA